MNTLENGRFKDEQDPVDTNDVVTLGFMSALLTTINTALTTINSAITSINSSITSLTSSLAGKFNTPGGTTAQVIRGDGSVGPVPGLNAYGYTLSAVRTIQTVAAAANGWQLSSTRNAMASYSATITTTATIAGSQQGYIVMEIAATNSAVAANWSEVSRITNGQAISLAIALQSVQPIGGQMMGLVPAGYYVRIRSVSTVGTPTYTYNSGMEVLL